MLLHVGDVLAVPSNKVCEHFLSDSSSALGRHVQLPEAFDSDDDEPLCSASEDLVTSSRIQHSDESGDVEVEDILCVRGAGVVSEIAPPLLSYTHSGCYLNL